MSDDRLQEQAALLEQLLPHMMRRLFTLVPEHLASDVPMAQLRVCAILQHGPRSLSAISEELSISVSAATQIADRMEKSDLVERVTSVDDRRVRYLQLTQRGAEMMRLRREVRVERAEQALKQLTPEQREAALSYVQLLLEASIATAPDIPSADPTGVRLEQA